MVDREEDADESLIRDVKVRFTPERTVTAVGKQRIVRRALIPDSLTWEIYDKPSKKKPSGSGSDSGTTPPRRPTRAATRGDAPRRPSKHNKPSGSAPSARAPLAFITETANWEQLP